jgi:queuine tRNA-ribosyltransferase
MKEENTNVFKFEIEKKSSEANLARVGKIITPHGEILTPAFIPVGTKATVKSLQPKDILEIGSQAVLANTYHLYLQPGQEIVKQAGGFCKFMNWSGPSFTDSGGFQVLSLGAAFDTGVTKIATSKSIAEAKQKEVESINSKGEKETKIKSTKEQMAKVDEEGVTFKSFIDGSSHRFTPEISMQIQHDLGADIFFAFDECTSPLATREYQIKAMDRTHRWAERCVAEHKKLGVSNATGKQQALFGVVQGGAYEDLRKISAETLGEMDFDGFGIGGSFTKEDMDKTVRSVTEVLPEGKPRHLLGIGEPIDFFIGVEYGIDTFDCVTPTRMGRHGSIFTENGKINLRNLKFKNDFSFISEDKSHPSFGYSYAYLSHLFRAEEMLAATIASKHNLHFLIKLVEQIRQSILDNNFFEFKKEFCERFYGKEM